MLLTEKMTDDNSIIDLWVTSDSGHNKVLDLPRRVGIDKIVVSCRVMSIDWNAMDMVLTSEHGFSAADRTLVVTDCRYPDRRLPVCDENDMDHRYSKIQVFLNQNHEKDQFVFSKSNLSNEYIISLLKVFVPPLEGHEILDNVSNLGYEQEKVRILALMDELERYGIHLDRNVAYIRNVEINVNICIMDEHSDFRDSIEIIRPYRHGLKGFTDSDYGDADENKILQIYGTNADKTKWIKKLGIPQRNKTSFNSISRSRIIKVYDKSAEIKSKTYKNRFKNDGIFVGFMSPITRLEFELKDRNEVRTFFDTDNFFELNQEAVEAAFHDLVSRYIKIPLDKYYRAWNRGLEQYFSKIDIHQYAWRKNTVIELDSQVSEADGFLIISFDDLIRYVS